MKHFEFIVIIARILCAIHCIDLVNVSLAEADSLAYSVVVKCIT